MVATNVGGKPLRISSQAARAGGSGPRQPAAPRASTPPTALAPREGRRRGGQRGGPCRPVRAGRAGHVRIKPASTYHLLLRLRLRLRHLLLLLRAHRGHCSPLGALSLASSRASQRIHTSWMQNAACCLSSSARRPLPQAQLPRPPATTTGCGARPSAPAPSAAPQPSAPAPNTAPAAFQHRWIRCAAQRCRTSRHPPYREASACRTEEDPRTEMSGTALRTRSMQLRSCQQPAMRMSLAGRLALAARHHGGR